MIALYTLFFILLSKLAVCNELLAGLPNCSDVIQDEELINNVCAKGSVCKISQVGSEYGMILCDCSAMANATHYFIGKYCEIAVPYKLTSSSDVNETLNTCFIEDLLGINDWKNNFELYSNLVG